MKCRTSSSRTAGTMTRRRNGPSYTPSVNLRLIFSICRQFGGSILVLVCQLEDVWITACDSGRSDGSLSKSQISKACSSSEIQLLIIFMSIRLAVNSARALANNISPIRVDCLQSVLTYEHGVNTLGKHLFASWKGGRRRRHGPPFLICDDVLTRHIHAEFICEH